MRAWILKGEGGVRFFLELRFEEFFDGKEEDENGKGYDVDEGDNESEAIEYASVGDSIGEEEEA